jgi:hypothetical protein
LHSNLFSLSLSIAIAIAKLSFKVKALLYLKINWSVFYEKGNFFGIGGNSTCE